MPTAAIYAESGPKPAPGLSMSKNLLEALQAAQIIFRSYFLQLQLLLHPGRQIDKNQGSVIAYGALVYNWWRRGGSNP
jgi:hypothetical protein